MMSSNPPPPPTPPGGGPAGGYNPMAALRQRFNRRGTSDFAVLLHILGLVTLPDIPPFARELAGRIRVISIDTEHWSNDTRRMTEVGMANFNVEDMMSVSRPGNFGPHGENLMNFIRFYLFRMIENSHLPNTNPESKGVKGNRFGRERFATFAEMRNILGDLFNQPYPVIVLGHAIGHDLNNFRTGQLAFDLQNQRSIIRFIDTQQIALDAGYWHGTTQLIGLPALSQGAGFNHDDPHTACNDIAHSVLAAIQIALIKQKVAKDSDKDLKTKVIPELETRSRDRNNYQHIGGRETYCWHCGSLDHVGDHCPVYGRLRCEWCLSRGRHEDSKTHVTKHCVEYANVQGDEKRRLDAEAKGRPPPPPVARVPVAGPSGTPSRNLASRPAAPPASNPSLGGFNPHRGLPPHPGAGTYPLGANHGHGRGRGGFVPGGGLPPHPGAGSHPPGPNRGRGRGRGNPPPGGNPGGGSGGSTWGGRGNYP